MTTPKRARLGKGLGALLGEDYLAPPGGADLRTLPTGRIVPNPFQPRREFREEELLELKNSIQENGLLQPLVVRPSPQPGTDRYQLIAGERRFRAVCELGWKEVSVVVREADDRTLLVLALVENIQREALSPVEEAEGYRYLAEEFSLTQGEIAEAVGKNRSTVANMLRLLRLPPSIRKLLEEGRLSMGHARALLAVEDAGRLVELGRRAAEEGWSVRQVEARARADGGGGGAGGEDGGGRVLRTGQPEGPVARALQEALQEALGARVRLREGRAGTGVIEVPFNSAEDFHRVFELMTGRDPTDVAG
jgi:ParB family transcriptional regulator, chromosome partitioning protein